jgi:hypothetical protein
MYSKKFVNSVFVLNLMPAQLKMMYPISARILQFWGQTHGDATFANLRAESSWAAQAAYILAKATWAGHQAQALG